MMHPVWRKGLAVTFFISVSLWAMAGDIDKAFKYLNTGDYANAAKYLAEVLADEPANAAANYGMAKYYFARDNKAYNLDSANEYIKKAAAKLPLDPEDKATKKYTALGVRDYTITTLLKDINNAAYGIAENANSVEAYQHYLDFYTDPGYINSGTNMRNQLAYIRARSKNDPKMLSDFISRYPQADQIKEAKELYEKLVYEQGTADGTYQAYKNYMDAYPKGAYYAEAKKNYERTLVEYYNNRHDLQGYVEFDQKYKTHPAIRSMQDSIYMLATLPGTVEAYKNFIHTYSANPNIAAAWLQLYLLYTVPATDSIYAAFIADYPDFPEKQRVEADRTLAQKDLKPVQQGKKWGFAYQAVNDSMTMAIPAHYEEAYEYSNGLAAVREKACDEKCTYYYIDKANKKAFDHTYNFAGNFENGFAIVGIGNCEEPDSCRYGIIDRRGEYVVAPVYEMIEDPTEGYYMVVQNDRYGFINARGEVMVSLRYTDALPFSEGVAAVAIDSNWFFIDRTGRQLFINRFLDVSSFSDSVCAVSENGDTWGYVDMAGNYIIPAQYESAEDFSGGYAIISKREKDPKNKALYISQRYKIDKKGKVIEKLTAPKPAKKTGGKRPRK